MKQAFKILSEKLKPGQSAMQTVTFEIPRHLKQFRRFCIDLGFTTHMVNRKSVMISGDSEAYGRLASKW